jgi:prepilin-type processing-associated H-X9-DG protein
MIGQAILLYANENKGKYPPDLGALMKTQDVTPEVFTCPSSDNNVPPNIAAGTKDQQAAWVNQNSSYIYVGQGMNFNAARADVIVLYEKDGNHEEDGMNFLYGDGHVEWQSMEVAQQLIKNAQKPAAAPAK